MVQRRIEQRELDRCKVLYLKAVCSFNNAFVCMRVVSCLSQFLQCDSHCRNMELQLLLLLLLLLLLFLLPLFLLLLLCVCMYM